MSSERTDAAVQAVAEEPSSPLILGRWRAPFFYGWIIVAVCYTADFFASGFGQSTISLFFQPMRDELGWSLKELVGASTAATIGGIFVSPFLGRIIDRFGNKPVMLCGTLVAGVGMVLMTFVQEVWQYWALYAAIGALGLAEFAGLASQAAVSNWFIYRRGRALMISTLGNTTGTIAGAPVVAFIITMVGWRQAWGVMGILLMGVLVPLVLILIHNRPEDVGLTPDGGWKPSGAAALRAAQVTDESWTLGEALRTRELWALMGVFVFGGSTIALNVTLAPYLNQEYGLSAQDVGWIISAFWIPASISRVIWGTLVDMLPARVCLFAVTVLRAAGPFCLAFTPYPINLGLWMLFSGLLGNAYGILQPVMLGNYFGRRSFASIQGGVRPFMALPGLAVPLVIAGLADYTGHFTAGFVFSGSIGLVGAACSFFAGAPRKAQPAETAAGAV